MTIADIANFIHGDPVMGTVFIICAVIFGLAVLALPIGLIWGITKSGKATMFSTAIYLVVQGAIAYNKFLGKGGQLLALGFVVGGIILFILGLYYRNKPELTEKEAEELDSRETRSILHSKSGKFIALLTAFTCFVLVWVIRNDKSTGETDILMLVVSVFGCAALLAFLFPSQSAVVFDHIGKYLTYSGNRRRY